VKLKQTLFIHLYTTPSEKIIRSYFKDNNENIRILIDKLCEEKEDKFLPFIYQEISGISILKISEDMKIFSYLFTKSNEETERDLLNKFIDKIKNKSIDLSNTNKITVNGYYYVYNMLNFSLERNRIKSQELSEIGCNNSFELKLNAHFRDYAFAVGLCDKYDLDLERGFYNINIDYLRQMMVMDSFIIAKLYYLQTFRKFEWFSDFEKINEYLNLQFSKTMKNLMEKTTEIETTPQ